MKKEKVYYKSIPLLPTSFTLDVIVSKDFDKLIKTASKKVGRKERFWRKWIEGPCVISSIIKGRRRIVMPLPDFDVGTIAHEATHVTWELDRYVEFRYSHDTHEVQAYLTEYLVNEILSMKP